MEPGNEEKLLVLELRTLCEEAMARSQSVANDDYQPRRIFALAQAAGCRDLMKYLVENDDWDYFGEDLEATLEGEESRYEDARSGNDRNEMIIALANRRVLKRLIRRLTDPRRRQLLAPELNSPAVGA